MVVTEQKLELNLASVEVTLFFNDGNTITLGRDVVGRDRVSLEVGTHVQDHSTISRLSLGFSVRQDKRLVMDIGIDEHTSTMQQSNDKLTT